MGIVAPIVFSATTWAGSAQFAVAAIIGSGGAVASAITAAILLSSRYLAMAAALAPSLTGSAVRRALHGLAVVDESWALSARGDGTFDPDKLMGVALTLFPAWVLGTAIGAIGGDAIGDPEALGLDAAFPALFLALMITQLRTRQHVAAALLGGLDRTRADPVHSGRRADHRRVSRGSRWVARTVSEVWLTIVVVGTATLAMKALPALLLGGRSVPPVVTGVFEALAPALLAALVVTQTFGGDEELVLDPRAAGLGAAAIAVALRSPIVATALVAAVAAAIVRALT